MVVSIKPVQQRTQIVSHRATCVGMQYRVADHYGTHIVTVNNGCIGCTCGLDAWFITCSHILVVEKQRETDALLDAKRALMQDLFEPANMDYLYN